MNISWYQEALAELDDASDYYEENAYGLGDDFLSEVNKAINKILTAPLSCRLVEHECRKTSLNRFPFSIIYFVHHENIVIVAIMHQKREPSYWYGRV